ncbi:hypothetical protein BGX34_008992 [Mortierella sp. NVP85]|nr:hypothetical protein BGX34_008992 [Mortierella sp. NVP85]
MDATSSMESSLLDRGFIAQKFGLKSTLVSFRKKAAWVGFNTSIFLMPYIILKACFHVHVSAGAWQTSVTYGMLMALDFMAVISFSALNRRRVNTSVKKRDPHCMSTGVLAAGYREDPIFIKVFEKQGAAVFRPNFLCKDRVARDPERLELLQQISHHPAPVCVMQPHQGKRCAMYTGFATLQHQGVESVVFTDSDTFLDPHVCKGKLDREYKRDFSYEELYENKESYPYLDGNKREVVRFAM